MSKEVLSDEEIDRAFHGDDIMQENRLDPVRDADWLNRIRAVLAAYISKAEPVAFGKTYMGELQDGWLELTREGAEIELDYLNSKYPDTTNQRAILPLYAAPDSSRMAGGKQQDAELADLKAQLAGAREQLECASLAGHAIALNESMLKRCELAVTLSAEIKDALKENGHV